MYYAVLVAGKSVIILYAVLFQASNLKWSFDEYLFMVCLVMQSLHTGVGEFLSKVIVLSPIVSLLGGNSFPRYFCPACRNSLRRRKSAGRSSAIRIVK